MKKSIEILAPAGSFESVTAAVRTGADAIYMGTKDFNARKRADNFSDSEVAEAIRYCHAHGVKVHITMNTLVSDEELPQAMSVVKRVCLWGADVLILQDPGLAELIKKSAPSIERHASTQMSVQTLSGVKLLSEMGYTRAVLPRECTKQEIENIKKNSGIEIEIFIHGAHCMSVSGQCYMSSMFGSRSGNRGLCAQPCRLPFSVEGGTGNDLSLKDLSLVKKIKEIQDIGVDSVKIEGRMKRPEYVAAAVTAVRSSLDEKDNDDILRKLRAVFSRSGFSDGYFTNNRGKSMFGTRQKQDVTAASSDVLKSLSKLYEKEQGKIPVSFCLTVVENEKVSLSASAMGKSCFVSDITVPEKANNKPLTKENLTDRLSKCGGTQFYAQDVEIELDEGLIVPASVINNLRRKALEELEIQLSSVKSCNFTDLNLKFENYTAKAPLKYNIRVAKINQIPKNLTNVENLYIPLNTEEKTVEKVKNLPVNVGFEVPRGIFGAENIIETAMLKMKNSGINIAYCSTLDAVAIAKKHGFEIHTGFSMNVFNTASVNVLDSLGVKEITLSPELTLSQLSSFGGKVKRGIIGYGRLPLMLTRNCPIRNGKDCNECKSSGYLTDRMGLKFPVVCSFGCSEILNSCPIYMADRMNEIKNLDFITFYFTKESSEMCEAVLSAYRLNKKAKGDFTRGLYYRGTK